MHEKQLRMLDKASERMSTAAEKASDVTSSVSGKAEQAASNVTMKASDAGEAVGAHVERLGSRGRDYCQGGTTAAEAALDLRCCAAAVLLLALGMSVGRRYFSGA